MDILVILAVIPVDPSSPLPSLLYVTEAGMLGRRCLEDDGGGFLVEDFLAELDLLRADGDITDVPCVRTAEYRNSEESSLLSSIVEEPLPPKTM